MNIWFVAAEAVPFAKVGGLGDVVGALPAALAAQGHDVTVWMPWYATAAGLARVDDAGATSFVWEGRPERAPVGRARVGAVGFAFVGLPDFAAGGPYGSPDDEARYVRLCLAVAGAVAAAPRPPDVVHAHDWHTALLPVLLRLPRGDDPAAVRPRTVLTLHNTAFQGAADPALLRRAGLPDEALGPDSLGHFGRANLLKGGIVHADHVTTVSATYARELVEPGGAMAHGLDGVLRAAADGGRLTGIVNGLDTDLWDPGADPHIAAPFGPQAPAGKAACAQALCAELGLHPPSQHPVLGMVARLTHDKGVDLVLDALPALLAQGWSLAVLGQGDPALVGRLAGAAADPAHAGRVALAARHDEALAHRIYAGAAGFLMPSRHEPCGLAQQIAMRYGAPPAAHAVGGLVDTVEDGVTGVLFAPATAEALAAATDRLRTCDRAAMARAGMDRDASWAAAARRYEDVYRARTTARA